MAAIDRPLTSNRPRTSEWYHSSYSPSTAPTVDRDLFGDMGTPSSWTNGGPCTQPAIIYSATCRPDNDAFRESAAAFSKAVAQWEATRDARAMSIAPIPARRPPKLIASVQDPLRHHKQRCFARRPRLSLRERVRKCLSRP